MNLIIKLLEQANPTHLAMGSLILTLSYLVARKLYIRHRILNTPPEIEVYVLPEAHREALDRGDFA